MNGILERVIHDLYDKHGGKIEIAIERFTDSIECSVRVSTGEPGAYMSIVELQRTFFDRGYLDDGDSPDHGSMDYRPAVGGITYLINDLCPAQQENADQ